MNRRDFIKSSAGALDVAKLGGGFDVKEDDQAKKNAKSEGLL